MSIKKRKTYELEIIDLAFGGKGLAKPEGFPIFIDRCVPGDKVFAKITKKKKSWGEAKLIHMITPSLLRSEGKCAYCNFCGGCKWQQLPYEKQLEYKRRHVIESLDHIGGLKNIRVTEVVPSERIFQYRNKMEFSCAAQRWLMPHELADETVKKGLGMGLHVPGTFDQVIDIKHCDIMPELGNAIMADVRDFVIASNLPAYHLRRHEGFWRFLMLRHSVAQDQWMVNIVTKTKNEAVVSKLGRQLAKKYPNIASIMNNITDAKSGVSMGKEEMLIHGKDHIIEQLADFKFKISANSFFQTNTRACEKLYTKVREYACLTGNETVLDLYSGTGTIPIWLSGHAKKIYGIEIVHSAVVDARENLRLNQIENCEFFEGDIKDVYKTVPEKADVIIIDPPRVGMHKDVVGHVLAHSPDRIVYVSCNPATLARDLEMLAPRYAVLEVTPVDMFPHTYHIESVALLVRRNMGERSTSGR